MSQGCETGEGAEPSTITRPVNVRTWAVPSRGILTFDYVSGKGALKNSVGQSEEVYLSFKRELSNPALFDEAKLLMLRTAATTHYWTARQARAATY